MEKLPNTWYVIVTEYNQKVLSDWRFGDASKLPIGAVTGIYSNEKKEWDEKFYEGHEWKNEITFEQFRKWVLKEDIELQYEIY